MVVNNNGERITACATSVALPFILKGFWCVSLIKRILESVVIAIENRIQFLTFLSVSLFFFWKSGLQHRLQA